MKYIYLDYAATTPVDPRVAMKMQGFLTQEGLFANPSSLHALGKKAADVVEFARAQIADYLHAEPSEIIFTSGATEANNLAIKGVAHLYQRKGKHIITVKTEHKAVLDPCQHLEKDGYQVTYLSPEKDGRVDHERLIAAIRPDTILVSMMHINNETGVITDLNSIAKITASRQILLHVDAAQSPGKMTLDLQQIPIDLLSLSAHKVYGPKGIGALFLRKKPRVRVEPLFHGGGHEQGMRSGTLATHQIVGMGEAFFIAKNEIVTEEKKIHELRKRFLDHLSPIKNLVLNTNYQYCVPHIINLRFEGMLADAILANVPQLAISTASACQGKNTEGSYVLRAMGLSDEQAKSSMRISFGRFTTINEIDEAALAIRNIFAK